MVEARTENYDRLRKIAQRIRVPSGFVMAPLLLFVARPTAYWLLAGGALALIGLLIRAWASGSLKKNQELATGGPYAFTRNPLYLGTFIMAGGIALSSGVIWFTVVFLALYLFIYIPVMLAEAEYMQKLFPEAYGHYQRHVPLFVPRLTPYQASKGGKTGIQDGGRSVRNSNQFNLRLYLRHREYRAALGVLIIYALLVGKYYW